MSTRAAIMYQEGDRRIGRYHHFDGYPQGLGECLILLRDQVFTTTDLVTEIIHKHPAGWSSLFANGLPSVRDLAPNRISDGMCLCHNDAPDAEWVLECCCGAPSRDVCPLPQGIEWVYLLGENELTICPRIGNSHPELRPRIPWEAAMAPNARQWILEKFENLVMGEG